MINELVYEQLNTKHVLGALALAGLAGAGGVYAKKAHDRRNDIKFKDDSNSRFPHIKSGLSQVGNFVKNHKTTTIAAGLGTAFALHNRDLLANIGRGLSNSVKKQTKKQLFNFNRSRRGFKRDPNLKDDTTSPTYDV